MEHTPPEIHPYTLRFRKVKVRLGCSAAHLSRMTGYSQTKVGNILKGTALPDAMRLMGLETLATFYHLFHATKKPAKR